MTPPGAPRHVAIAVPARNEAARLPRLLTALGVAATLSPVPVTVLLLINNSDDGSARLARDVLHPALRIRTVETRFARSEACAGHARRVAMGLAARPGGLLMTTDADAVPGPRFIAAALRAVAGGADLVCGRISTRVPRVLATPSGARITAAEAAYAALVHETRHRIDQMAGRLPPGDRRPHYVESGAALAIRADAFRAIGGLPPRRHGEDRALVHHAAHSGLAVRYCDMMHARVSGRLRGRAEGGMAECLRHRMQDADPLADRAMLTPAQLAQLWEAALAGDTTPFPDRSLPQGAPARASDLEARLPVLARFVEDRVRPDFAAWSMQGLRA